MPTLSETPDNRTDPKATMSNDTLDKLIWTLIFGGLLVGSLGLFVERQNEPLGWSIVVVGSVAAVVGVVLVWVRSRRPD